LADSSIDLVLIATPAHTHYTLSAAALKAGKHVFISKPMAATAKEASDLHALALSLGKRLAVDHTFLFTGAVQKIRDLLGSGDVGDIAYVDSVRINLGLIQSDIDVIWDLAPHDLSILLYLFDRDPIRVKAMGNRRDDTEQVSSAYLHLEYSDGMMAHCHLNWLAPVKIRRTLIAGTKQMIVYDDMEPSEKVKVYDRGVLAHPVSDRETAYGIKVDYRSGDMYAPKLSLREALSVEAEHVVASIRDATIPLISGGNLGHRIVTVLEAASLALRSGEGVRL
jgi:predicted dehydrogenase